MKTPADLAAYISQHGIEAKLVHPPHETPTVPLAAQAMQCSEEQIIKSLLFRVKRQEGEQLVLVITNGTAQVDRRKLATLFQVSQKRIKLAQPELVAQATGYPAGGVPPFGYPRPIPTYLDRSVLGQPYVYGGGGDEHTLLRITPQELLRVTGAQVIDAH